MGIKAAKQAAKQNPPVEGQKPTKPGTVQVSLHLMTGKGGFEDRAVNLSPELAALFDHGGLIVSRFDALTTQQQYDAMRDSWVANAIRLNAGKVDAGGGATLDLAVRNWIATTSNNGAENGTLSSTAPKCPTAGLPGVVYA